ncbi:MAG: GAF domain-containing protein, partial [Anaerolineae bacterium]|nr:GAF domain-containing protein [Anaerolineae bacterium]
AAIAIENARLFDQTRRRLNDLGTLLDASAAVSSTLDFGSILELIARRLLDALQVERCLIAAWDRASNIMESLAEVVDSYWPVGTGPESSLEQLRLRRAALVNGLPVLAHVRDRTADAADRLELQEAGHQALLSFPLRIDGEIVGLVSLYSSLPGHRFHDDDATQADRIAEAWANKMGHRAARAWRLEKSLTVLCDQLVVVPGVTWVSIEAWEHETDRIRRLREQGFALWTEQGGVRRNLADYHTMTRVLSIAQPKVVGHDDLDADPNEQQWLARTGGRVCLMAPLIIQGKPGGLVKLIESDARRAFNAEEISLCQGIANVVSNAMENAQLYQSLERRAEALEAAYGELQQADQIKDELLQNLSHELQTPLLHILGYAELLHTEAFGSLNEAQQERMEFIIQRVDHLSELVKDIISVQALQSQKIELKPTDLYAVIQQAMRVWELDAEKQAVRLELATPPVLSPVRADQHLLTEAVEHLLDNAIKFSPDGGMVEISVHNRGGLLEVRICDQGVGIPKEAQPLIFKRFYQVDGGATRRFGGTGLGLSIVREIIARHGGDIWVESEPGQGSTFFFTVPKAETGPLPDLSMLPQQTP